MDVIEHQTQQTGGLVSKKIQQKISRLKLREQKTQKMQESVKVKAPDIHVIGFPEEKERENGS